MILGTPRPPSQFKGWGGHRGKGAAHFFYTGKWAFAGVLLDRPWDELPVFVRRAVAMQVRAKWGRGGRTVHDRVLGVESHG